MSRFLAFAALIAACGGSSATPVVTVPHEPSPHEASAKEPRVVQPAADVTVLGEGIVWRQSDSDGPPWRRIEVTNVFGFDREPARGDRVTVLPLRAELPLLQLGVVSTKKRDEVEEEPVWWEVELEPVTDRAYFDIAAPPDIRPEYPSDVVVLYPAVASALLVPRDALDSLPPDTPLATIEAAADWTGDGKADGLWVSHCCTDRKVTSCDYTCSETYRRAQHRWRLVRRAEPL